MIKTDAIEELFRDASIDALIEPRRDWRDRRAPRYHAGMKRNGTRALKAMIVATAFAATPALAHDFWSNGDPVPSWVRAECCGPRDVHHLRPSAVHIESDGYHIDGIKTVIPIARALPSMDGDYWAFWNPIGEPEPVIFCFFAPLNGA